jgi:hypothetical protein
LQAAPLSQPCIAARFGYVCSLELGGPPRKSQRSGGSWRTFILISGDRFDEYARKERELGAAISYLEEIISESQVQSCITLLYEGNLAAAAHLAKEHQLSILDNNCSIG